MARRAFRSSGDSVSVTGLLPTLNRDPNDANPRKRSLGRTGDSLEKLKEEAKAEGRELGMAEGFEAGKLEGVRLVQEQMEAYLAEFAAALQSKTDQVIFAIRQYQTDSEPVLAQLATAIAADILSQEIATTPDCITRLTQSAIQQLSMVDSIRIRVNPFDVPTLRDNQAALIAACGQLQSVQIVDDPTIQGGCIIESDAGAIDATIDTKLQLVRESFQEAA